MEIIGQDSNQSLLLGNLSLKIIDNCIFSSRLFSMFIANSCSRKFSWYYRQISLFALYIYFCHMLYLGLHNFFFSDRIDDTEYLLSYWTSISSPYKYCSYVLSGDTISSVPITVAFISEVPPQFMEIMQMFRNKL